MPMSEDDSVLFAEVDRVLRGLRMASGKATDAAGAADFDTALMPEDVHHIPTGIIDMLRVRSGARGAGAVATDDQPSPPLAPVF